jgi:hypothetical protein
LTANASIALNLEASGRQSPNSMLIDFTG